MALTLTPAGLNAPDPLSPQPVTPATLDPNEAFGMEAPDWRDDYEKQMDEWRHQSFKALDGAVLDPKAYTDERIPGGWTPDEWRKTRIVDDWMRLHTDGQDPPMGLQREFERARLAQQVFKGAGADSDDALFAEIQSAAQGRQATRELMQEIHMQAVTDAMTAAPTMKDGQITRGNLTWPQVREQIQGKPGYDPAREAEMMARFYDSRAEAKQKLAAYKAPLDMLFGAMQSGEPMGPVAYDTVSAIPRDKQDEFLEALELRAQTLPKEEQAAFWSNFSKSLRGIDSFRQGAVENYVAMGLGSNVAEMLPPGMALPPDASGQGTAGERVARQREFQLDREFVRRVQEIEQGVYDPVQYLTDEGSAGRIFEEIAYQTVPVTVNSLTMAIPFVGLPAMFGGMKGASHNQLMSRFTAAGMDTEDAIEAAEVWSVPMAITETALEKAQYGIWSRQLPGFSKFLDTLGDKIVNRGARFGMKALAIGTAETAVEIAQDTGNWLIQDAAAALNEDLPDVQWTGEGGALDGFWANNAVIFGTMLPLSILGAAGGLSVESRNAAFRKATPLERTALGITPEASAAIDAATGPASLATAIENAWQTRDPNSPEAQAAVEQLKQRVEQARRASAMLEGMGYSFPGITVLPDGMFVVRDNLTGEEVGRASDSNELREVVNAHSVAMETMQEDEMLELGAWLASARVAAKESGIEQELNLSRRFGMADVEAMGPAAMERFMAEVALQEQAEGGDGSAARTVFGYNITESRAGMAQTVNRIFQGANIGTLFHENWHSARRKAKAAGTLTREDDIRFLRALDTVLQGKTREVRNADGSTLVPATRKSFIPEGMQDADISEELLDEAISEVAEVLTFLFPRSHKTNKHGLTRKIVSTYLGAVGRLAPEATRKFSAFIRAIRAKMGLAMSRAYHLKKGIAAGTIDPKEIDAYMAKLMGTDAQQDHDDGVRAELNRILNMPEDVADDDIPFSIGRAVDARDTEYLAAVKAGDMAKAEKMVIEAAKAAGYEGPYYHGGTVEDAFRNNPEAKAHYASEDPEVATTYAEQFSKDRAKLIPLMIRSENLLDLTDAAIFKKWVGDPSGSMIVDAMKSGGPFIDKVKAAGFDAVKFFDSDASNRGATPAIAFFTPSQAKLSPRDAKFILSDTWWGYPVMDGTVTRDEQGNVIPLSQRFNPETPDIRFSLGRATVTPSAATRAIQGSNGETVIGPASFAIGAWHGTPHKVDKFSTDKIGTGEGAQAYGWGLYFAEDRSVGETYRKQLSYKDGAANRAAVQKPIEELLPVVLSKGRTVDILGKKSKVKSFSMENGEWHAMLHDGRRITKDVLAQSTFDVRNEYMKEVGGNLYRVTLKVEDEDLLDWDKPLSEQSEKVIANLKSIQWIPANLFSSPVLDESGEFWTYQGNTYESRREALEDATGFELVMGRLGGKSPKQISQDLHAAGIRGIRYLDGNSRGTGKGSYNYVIFDEADIEIVEENGTPVKMEEAGASFSIGRAVDARDTEYLAAVEAGDMDTAQRMVDEAAKAAGYKYGPLYHSRLWPFNKFDPYGKFMGASGVSGIHLTDSKKMAERYLERYADRGWIDGKPNQLFQKEVIRVYAKIENPLIRDEPFSTQLGLGAPLPTGYVSPVESMGYDALIRNDSINRKGTVKHATAKNAITGKEFILTNPSNIKSADPVTYDESGNVIPLSQRFNPETPDIRFSIGRAEVAERMQGGALALVRDPIRRVQAMSRIARDFGDLFLSFQRIEALAGRRRSKAQLRQEANAREDMAAEEKIGAIWAKFGGILADDEVTRLKAQPVFNYLAVTKADGVTIDPLRGRLMSKARYMKRNGDFQIGQYNGADGISRTVFGGNLTPGDAATNLFDDGLIAEPTPDAMWEALAQEQKSVISKKELYAKAIEQIREARREAKREASEWLQTQGKEQETNYNPKEEILASLRMLDAILLALPPEIRGKIGGYTQMAKITTDEARLSFLKDKLKKADKELEQFLRESFNREWLDLLKRAKPDKDNPGERPTGVIDADALDILRAAEAAMWMSFAQGEAEADRLDALAEHEDTKPEDAEKLRATAQMVRLTANWSAADAARREQAVLEGTRIYYGGLAALRIKQSARAARLRDLQASAKRGTGKAGDRMERKKMQRKERGSRAGQASRLVWEFLSFGQLVNVLFGEKSNAAKWFNAREIAASNAYEDGVQAKADALESMLETLAGSRFGGEKLRHRMQTEERITTTDALGKTHTFTESEAITFLLMWQQEDGKRHMEGQMDDEGNLVSEWGWTEQNATEIEAALFPEAKAMLAFLSSSYGEEYGRINDVFRRIWNVSMPRHKMYAPLTVKPTMGKQDAIVDPVSGDAMGVGMTPGSLKNRSQTAVTEPDFRDAFQVFLTHARQMEHFIAYAEFARDAMAIVNRREMRNSIEAVSPTAAMALGKWVDYFALGGLREAAAGGGWQQFFAGALSRLSSAALVGRISVLGMQALQLGAAAYKMPLGAFLSRFARLQMGKLSWAETIQSDYIQRRMKEMPPIVRDAVMGLAAGTPNRAKYLATKAARTIPGADGLFTAGTYAILYDYHLTQARKAGIPDPEKYAHAEAERLTDQVAQPVRTGARSWLEVSSQNQPAFRALWNFASDPRQKMALIVYDAMRHDISGKEKAAAVAKAVAVTWAVSGILQATVRAVFRDLRNDDDDEIFDERHWDLKKLGLMAATGPLGGIPYLGGMLEGMIYKAAGEWMPNNGLLDALTQSVPAGKRLLTGDWDDVLKDIESVLTGGATLSGTSAAGASGMHVIRDAVNLYENFDGKETDD